MWIGGLDPAAAQVGAPVLPASVPAVLPQSPPVGSEVLTVRADRFCARTAPEVAAEHPVVAMQPSPVPAHPASVRAPAVVLDRGPVPGNVQWLRGRHLLRGGRRRRLRAGRGCAGKQQRRAEAEKANADHDDHSIHWGAGGVMAHPLKRSANMTASQKRR